MKNVSKPHPKSTLLSLFSNFDTEESSSSSELTCPSSPDLRWEEIDDLKAPWDQPLEFGNEKDTLNDNHENILGRSSTTSSNSSVNITTKICKRPKSARPYRSTTSSPIMLNGSASISIPPVGHSNSTKKDSFLGEEVKFIFAHLLDSFCLRYLSKSQENKQKFSHAALFSTMAKVLKESYGYDLGIDPSYLHAFRSKAKLCFDEFFLAAFSSLLEKEKIEKMEKELKDISPRDIMKKPKKKKHFWGSPADVSSTSDSMGRFAISSSLGGVSDILQNAENRAYTVSISSWDADSKRDSSLCSSTASMTAISERSSLVTSSELKDIGEAKETKLSKPEPKKIDSNISISVKLPANFLMPSCRQPFSAVVCECNGSKEERREVNCLSRQVLLKSTEENCPICTRNSTASTSGLGPAVQRSRYKEEFFEVRRLGSGGFGAVYEAENLLDNIKYAVKRIKFQRMRSPTQLPKQVLREVRCLARLDHPNIVRYFCAWLEVYEIFDGLDGYSPNEKPLEKKSLEESPDGLVFNEESGDRSPSDSNKTPSALGISNDMDEPQSPGSVHYQMALYIQMQLCSFPLSKWLERSQRIVDHHENIHIFKQIVEALAYIHGKNQIHRDLKPNNVFVYDEDGSISDSGCLRDAVIKIGDFGVATFIGETFGRDETFQKEETPEKKVDEILRMMPPSPAMPSFLENLESIKNLSAAFSSNVRTTGIGTTTYSSPEQLRKDVYDEKTDIWSLGIILLELYVPFYTKMERSRVLNDLRHSHIVPSSLKTSYPVISDLILQCTNEDPCQRPSAQEILNSEVFTTNEGFAYSKNMSNLESLLALKEKQLRQALDKIQELENKCKN